MASKQLEQYKKLKAELDSEYQRRLKALRDYCGVDESETEEHPTKTTYTVNLEKLFPNSISQRTLTEINPGEYGSLNAAVKKAIQIMNGNFTATQLWEKIKEFYPTALRPSVSAVLSKMAENSEIQVMEEGRGNIAAVYHKKAG